MVEEKVDVPIEEAKPKEDEPVEDIDDDKELISGEEFNDTGQPDLSSLGNMREENEEIDLVEGTELDDK